MAQRRPAMSRLYGSVPANSTTKWHPEPTFRGTYSILSSCLITMGLCVWTAVHLNIPAHHEGKRKWWTPQFGRKLKWLLIGVFAPEVIAWVAFEQRRQAARISRDVTAAFAQGHNNRDAENVSVSRDGEARGWSTTHSYFTLMGGFVIDIRDARFMVSKRYDQLALTSAGILLVANYAPHLIPDIPEGVLKDKSKANGLAKTLVCLQAGWFCVQCVTRLVQGLAISLLELNTFAHAVCTILIYFLWWGKPLDVEEAVSLQGEGLRELCAYLLVLGMGIRDSAMELQDAATPRLIVCSQAPHDWEIERYGHQIEKPRDDVFRVRNVKLCGTYVHGTTLCVRHEKDGSTGYSHMKYADLTPSEFDLLQLGLAETVRFSNPYSGRLCSVRATNIPMDDFSITESSVLFSFLIAGLCYGGIHLSAWHAPFPNHTQAMLWRISGLTLAASGFFISSIVWAVGRRTDDLRLTRTAQISGRVYWSMSKQIGRTVSSIFYYGLYLFYVLGRVYLVVECFIGMAHLPDKVYKVPQWSQYFPHIA